MISKFSAAADAILQRRSRILAAMFASFAAMALLKFAAITVVVEHGITRRALGIGSSILDGALAAAVVWLVFALLREQRRQVRTNIQAIAELHEQLQNVLYAVVQIKDEASDEDIADFMHALDKTACTLRGLLAEHGPTSNSRKHRPGMESAPGSRG